MSSKSKPTRIFFSPLTNRFYAVRSYKQMKGGFIAVTGEQHDVTADIEQLLGKHFRAFIRDVERQAEADMAQDEIA